MTPTQRPSTWFQRGADAAERILPAGYPRCYICPLCQRGFLPGALEADLLTVEHVPPKGLGGRRLLLTCRRCNSSAGAHLDHEMLKRELILDFHHGTMERPAPARLVTEGQTLNVEVRASGTNVQVTSNPGSNDPRAEDAMTSAFGRMVGEKSNNRPELRLEFYKGFRHRPALVGWLRAGYLAAFAALGYRYILRPTLHPVRQQLANPHQNVLRVFSVTMPDFASKAERRILLVERPKWLTSIAVQMGRQMILLPGLEDGSTLYERLVLKANQQAQLRLQGKLIPWPTKPEYDLDFL